MAHRFLRLLIIAAAALAVPATATAAERPPVLFSGTSGVTVVQGDVHLSGKAAKQARYWVGKRLDASCEKVSHAASLGSGVVSGGLVIGPRRFRGKVIDLGSPRGKDYCVVTHARQNEQDEPVAVVALSAAGRAWVDELQIALLITSLPLTGDQADGALPSVDEVVRENPKLFVALSGPDAAPPSGKAGYWTDGAQHAVVAMTAKSGRRLFVEVEADGVIRTNTLEYLGTAGLL